MKKYIIALTVLFLAASGVQAQKMAFVNTAKIIDTLPMKDSADIKYQKKAMEFQERLQEMEDEYAKLSAEIEKKKAGGSSDILISMDEQRLQRLAQDYQSAKMAMQQDLNEEEAKLLKPILEEIKAAVAVVAKQKGYTSALDNSSEVVLFMNNPADDITEAVIAYMLKKK